MGQNGKVGHNIGGEAEEQNSKQLGVKRQGGADITL
jgi:hypothetical protein